MTAHPITVPSTADAGVRGRVGRRLAGILAIAASLACPRLAADEPAPEPAPAASEAGTVPDAPPAVVAATTPEAASPTEAPTVPATAASAPAAPAEEAAPDREQVLAAIRMVETGDRPERIGSLGERGAYQFRYRTWRQHSPEAFRLAHTPHADIVARRHFAWLCERLAAHRRPADVYHVALAWNAGLTAVLQDRAPARAHDYAARVRNLALAEARALAAR